MSNVVEPVATPAVPVPPQVRHVAGWKLSYAQMAMDEIFHPCAHQGTIGQIPLKGSIGCF